MRRHLFALAWRLVSPAVALVGVRANAADLAPTIDHQPLYQAARGEPIVVRARITAVSGKPIFDPTVYVRVPGISGFAKVPMQAQPGVADLFAAQVPASLTASDFEYYLEAYDHDGNGPGRAGTPDRPFHVATGAAAPPPMQTSPPPPPPVVVEPPPSYPPSAYPPGSYPPGAYPPPSPSPYPPPPPPVVSVPMPAEEVKERLGFLGLSGGIGGTYAGLVGVSFEGGIKWVTGFLSLGVSPSYLLGSFSSSADYGAQIGVRGMFGNRRFKGWVSASYGGTATLASTNLINAAVFQGGGRVFFAGTHRRLFFHFGFGFNVPTFASSNPINYFAFDLGFGVDFIGR